jgi:hypothetical protein
MSTTVVQVAIADYSIFSFLSCSVQLTHVSWPSNLVQPGAAFLAVCRAVARGARRSFLVGDLPFGSYETSVRDAVVSATRVLKEGQMDAVKLEGELQLEVTVCTARAE